MVMPHALHTWLFTFNHIRGCEIHALQIWIFKINHIRGIDKQNPERIECKYPWVQTHGE